MTFPYNYYSELNVSIKNETPLPSTIKEDDVLFAGYQFGKKGISFGQRYQASLSIGKNYFTAFFQTFSSYLNAKTNFEVVKFYFKAKKDSMDVSEERWSREELDSFAEGLKYTYYEPTREFLDQYKFCIDRTVPVASSFARTIFSTNSLCENDNTILQVHDIRRHANDSDLLCGALRPHGPRYVVLSANIERMFKTKVIQNYLRQRNELIALLGGELLDLSKIDNKTQKEFSSIIISKLNSFIANDEYPREVYSN